MSLLRGSMDGPDAAWLIGAGFVSLVGAHLGNSLQSFGSKLAAPDDSSSHTVVVASSSPSSYAVDWALIKLFDVCFCCACWWLVSWALALGKGDASLLLGTTQFSVLDLKSEAGGFALCFYTFTLLTCSLGIFQEAVADHWLSSRYGQVVYRGLSLVFCLVVFPFLFHWVWSDNGWASPFRSPVKSSLLAGCGVIDTAGCSVVHMSAGVASAVLFLFVKGRNGGGGGVKDDGKDDGKVVPVHLDSLRSSRAQTEGTGNIGALLHLLGTLIMWGGSCASHAVNNLPLLNSSTIAGNRVAMTTVGVSSAAVTAFVASSFLSSAGRYTSRDAIAIGRCAVTALVAMGACCSSCEFEGAFAIGVIAALMQMACSNLCTIVDFDDASGAIGVHTLGGVWGLFAAGLLTSQAGYKQSYGEFYLDGQHRSVYCKGVFYGGGGNQLAANIVFMLATLSWTFVVMLVVVFPLKLLLPTEFDVTTAKSEQEVASTYAVSTGLDEKQAIASATTATSTAAAAATAATAAAVKQSTATADAKIASAPPQSQASTSTTARTSKLLLPAGASGLAKLVSTVSAVSTATKAMGEQAAPVVPLLSEEEDDEKFERENGYCWDVAIVFKAPKPKSDGTHKSVLTFIANRTYTSKNENGESTGEVIKPPGEIITMLNLGGFETRVFYSNDKSRILCKVRAPLQVFRTSADLSDVKLLLDGESLKCAAESGWEGVRDGKKIKISPISISDGKKEHLTSYSPYECIYSSFDEVEDAPVNQEGASSPQEGGGDENPVAWPNLYAIAPNLKRGVRHGFGSTQRIKLIHDILTHDGEKGCGLNFQELINGKPQQVLTWYPLHDEEQIENLRTRWLAWNVMPWQSPTDDIRNYFGEKIGLYFHFLSHYCTSLLGIGLLGVLVVVHLVVVSVQYGSIFGALRYMYSIPIYCFLITLWASWFLETWMCKERNASLRWGMVGFESSEGERSDFKGTPINSWIDGSYPTKAFDRVNKRWRLQLSSSSLSLISCIVVGVFSATFFLKFWLKMHNQTQYSVFADIINALSIMVLDALYKKFAVYMTNFENHRTDTQYEDSIILKLFVFGFFNSYCPSIYIAYIKQLIGDPCTLDSCMGELGQTMLIIFGSRLFVSGLVKILLPRISRWMERRREASEMRKTTMSAASVANNNAPTEVNVTIMTSTEEQSKLEEYNDVFDDYNELSVQFGYICLFAPAFPLAPLLSFLSNFLEIRADGFKVLKQMRRAWPHGAEDVGTWYSIFEALSVISVFTNAGLIFFTMDLFDDEETSRRLGLFIAYCFGVLILRQCFGRFINLYPEEVDIQLARQQVLVDKVIKKVPDEDRGADLERLRKQRLRAKTSITLLPTDRHEEKLKEEKLEHDGGMRCCR